VRGSCSCGGCDLGRESREVYDALSWHDRAHSRCCAQGAFWLNALAYDGATALAEEADNGVARSLASELSLAMYENNS